MGMSIDHQFWDGFFAVFAIAWVVGIGVWIWKKNPAAGFWPKVGFWSMVWGMAAAAQLAARGFSSFWLWTAAACWLGLTALTALLLGIRHLLARRHSGQVAH